MGGELVAIFVEHLSGVRGYSDLTSQVLLAIVAARSVTMLGLALFGVYAILQAPLTSIGLRRPKVAGLAVGAAIGLAAAFIFPWLIHDLRLHNSYHLQYFLYIIFKATGLVAAASIVVYLFVTPIVEEIVFRGIVLEGLIGVTNEALAVIVSAIAFAGIHLAGGAAQIAGAFMFGLVAGWLYLRTRSIVATSVAHIIYDAVAFYPLLLFAFRAKHF